MAFAVRSSQEPALSTFVTLCGNAAPWASVCAPEASAGSPAFYGQS